MKVLVINCGSSSLKYQLIDSQTEEVLAKGLCERIGIEGSKLTHKPTGKEDYVVESPMKDHQIAVKLVLDALTDKDNGVITDRDIWIPQKFCVVLSKLGCGFCLSDMLRRFLGLGWFPFLCDRDKRLQLN